MIDRKWITGSEATS